MLLELAPRAPISDGVRHLARALTGRDAGMRAAEKAPTSILSFLTSRKRA
jgi:hypothetical protein